MRATRANRFVEFPRAALAHSLVVRFEETAARHAARPAVQHGDDVLTYAQLNAFADRVGAAVRDGLGNAPAPVALLLDHGVLAPAAALGVLKAGGVFVPLHPGHPTERNALVLRESGARLVLTDRVLAGSARVLAGRAGGTIDVCAVEEVPDVAGPSAAVSVPADAPCFVLYTSGSTGQPKGVCQIHRTMLHGTMLYTNLARIDADDRLSLVHGLTTQIGATAMFAALLNGATLLPFDLQRQGLDALASWTVRERITVLHTMPTVFRRFAQRLAAGVLLEDVRLVRLVGEPLTQTEWTLFHEHCPPHAAMLVGLGSTEALNYRQRLYAREDGPGDTVLPVGDAVPDKDVLLVDPEGHPVPPGDVGEILVRSEFLFAGYWRRPDLTAEVLSVDPADPRRQIFRTGDLGRLTPDGRFFHAGRRDHLVKVAGNRVEVAEIEHALRRVRGIRDAAVVPRRRGANEVRLVAFVTLDGQPPSRRELRARLVATLPDHMIPAAFIQLDDLPALAGGKIDRRALEERVTGAQAPHEPPRNAVEETLVEIWQHALGVEGIGVHDDFFLDLGGDSLAATQVLADVAHLFDRELPLSTFHEATTVAGLGACLLAAGWRPPESGRLVLNAAGARPPLFALCGAFGHALRLLLIGRALGDEQPFYGLQPPAMNWEAAGCRTIEEMATHYVGEIQRLQPHGPYRLLGTSLGGVMAFEIATQLQRAGEAVHLLAMVDTAPPDCVDPDGHIDRAERRDWAAGVPTDEPLVAMSVRVARAHLLAYDAYVLRRRFDGEILYFKCLEPPVPPTIDRRRLWERFATEGMRVVGVPGIHGHFHREPQLSAVVRGLRAALRDGGTG